jgi:hypothetical protein
MSWLKLFLSGLLAVAASPAPPDANAIIQRSIQVLKKDWQAAPDYDYVERDSKHQGSRKYRVLMILGSPYRCLEAINDEPLSTENQRKEEKQLQNAIARRCGESKQQTEKRVREYKKDLERDHRLIEKMTSAFTFKVVNETTIEGRKTWHLDATPRPDFQPDDKETKVLTGMRGKLWIDEETFQWKKVEAQVIHPVSIEGFLARVEPGTKFEFAQAPVPGGVWLPSQFSFGSKAKVFSFIEHNTQDHETYSDYQKAEQVKLPGCSDLSGGDKQR